MLKFLLNFFKAQTAEESYAAGLKCARVEIQGTSRPLMKARELYAIASGGLSDTDCDRAYDRGVRDGLEQLGYSDPY